jgi:hypothetical protein
VTDARQQRIDTLKAAAQRKSADKISAAESAIRRLIKRGEAVTFQAVQREAAVSHAFLYNNQQLRARIEYQRRQHRPEPSSIPGHQDSDNNIITALSAQIARLKSQHRAEAIALREALAKAHGENLDLRRELHRLRA